jgi:hypothetical protein
MFETFANALIERTLPRVREWIVERFGPGASLGSMEIEGKKVHLDDVRVPLGSRIVLTAKRATLITRAEDLMTGGFDALSLEALEGGAITIGSIRARVGFAAEPSAGEWVRGRLTLDDVDIAGERFTGNARVRVDASAWSIEDGVIERGSARLTLAMGGAVSSGPRLAHARTSAAAFPSTAVAEILGVIGLAVPSIVRAIAARISGTASYDPSADRISVHAEARTDSSYLALELESGARAIKSGSLRGKVGWDDVLAPDLRAHVRGASPITVSLDGTGLADARGSLRCPQIDLRWLKTPLAIDAHLDAGKAELDVAGDGVGFKGEALLDREIHGGGSGTLEPRALALGDVSLDGALASFGVLVRGSLRAPKADVTLKSDRLVITREDASLALSKIHARVQGSAIEARARMGTGTIQFAKNRLRAERVDAMPIAALFGARVPFDGVLWADLARAGASWAGTAHLEGAKSRITAAPLRFDADERALDGTKIAAILGAADLARWIGGPFAPREGSVEVELTVTKAELGRLRQLRAEGLATSRVLELGLARRTFSARSLRVPLVIDGGRAIVADASVTIFGGEVRASCALDRSGLSIDRISIDHVGAGLARWLGAGDALHDLSIDGVLARDGDVDLAGTLDVRTARSSFSVRPRVHGSSLGGTDLEGEIEVADLAPLLGKWAGAGRWELKGSLDGTLSDPHAVIDARAARQILHAGPAELPLEDVRARVAIGRDHIAWRDASAELHGGAIRTRGVFGRSAGARLELEGVDLGQITALQDYAAGKATITIDAWRGAAGTFARGDVRVDDPSYRVLARAKPTMTRLGLRMVAVDGKAPLTALARFANGRLRVSDIGARVPEVGVSGAVAVSPELVDGRLVLAPDAEWVRASPYLSPFADLLASAGLPILIGGTLDAPRIRPDYRALGDHVIARSPIFRRLRAILDRVFPGDVEEPNRPDEHDAHAASSLLSTDTIFDRLADNPEDAEALFELLLDRGFTAADIAERAGRGPAPT